MRYPELLLIPTLMMADHYFTIWSALLVARSGGDPASVELNPLAKESGALCQDIRDFCGEFPPIG